MASQVRSSGRETAMDAKTDTYRVGECLLPWRGQIQRPGRALLGDRAVHQFFARRACPADADPAAIHRGCEHRGPYERAGRQQRGQRGDAAAGDHAERLSGGGAHYPAVAVLHRLDRSWLVALGEPGRRPARCWHVQAFTSAQLTSPPGPGIPYVYNLDFVDPPDMIPAQDYIASAADLATVTERYYQDVRSTGAWSTDGGTDSQLAETAMGGNSFPLPLPGTQIQYMTADPAILWQTEYWRTSQLTGGQVDALRALQPGQQVDEDWNRYPLHPAPNVSLSGSSLISALPSAVRSGNTLAIDITPFSDNQLGHTGAGFSDPEATGTYQVDQNGVRIAAGNAATAAGGDPDLFVQAPLSRKPSVIRFVLTAAVADPHDPLSSASRDVWTCGHARSRGPRSRWPGPARTGRSTARCSPC